MNSEQQKYVEELKPKVEKFRKALTRETDRGSALFAAAYLDKGPSDLLYVSLVANKGIEKDLFEGTQPLSAFSSRMKMAYYLGLISSSCRRDLEIIKGIGNDFAHKTDVDSFENQSIRDRCRALSHSYRDQQAGARAHYFAAVMGTLARIHIAMITTVSHTERSDDAPTEQEKSAHRSRIAEIVNEMRQTSVLDTTSE